MLFSAATKYYEFDKLEIELNKNLLKRERLFLNYLVAKIKKSKDLNMLFPLKKIYKVTNTKSLDEFKRFLEKLFQKKLRVILKNKDEYVLDNTFSILSSFSIKDDFIHLSFSKEVDLSFKRGNIYNTLRVLDFISLTNKFSFYFLHELVECQSERLGLKVEVIKAKLNLKDSYERFFDFEKQVIKEVFEDINLNTTFDISYKKIKDKQDGRKIDAIMIMIKDVERARKEKELNELLAMIKTDTKSFDQVMNMLKKELEINSFEEVKRKVEMAVVKVRLQKLKIKDALEDIINKKGKKKVKGRLIKEKKVEVSTQLDFLSALYAFIRDVEIAKMGHLLFLLNKAELRKDTIIGNDFFDLEIHYLGGNDYQIFIYEKVYAD